MVTPVVQNSPVAQEVKAPEPKEEKMPDPMEMLVELKEVVWDFLKPFTPTFAPVETQFSAPSATQTGESRPAPAPLLLTSSVEKSDSTEKSKVSQILTTVKTVVSKQVVEIKNNVAKAKTAVYFDMNSTKLDANDRQVLRNLVNAVSAKLSPDSKVTMKIVGWVQPTKISPSVDNLSAGRAKAALDYLKSLGMKNADIQVVAPGEGKANVSTTRMATIDVTWTNPAVAQSSKTVDQDN